jgi:hypothetical protein
MKIERKDRWGSQNKNEYVEILDKETINEYAEKYIEESGRNRSFWIR